MKEGYIQTKSEFFRDNTAVPMMKLAYCYNFGGLGDFINWTTAIQCAIESFDYTEGIVVTPNFFADLADLWLSKYAPRFTVYRCDDIKADKKLREYIFMKGPNMYDNVDALGHNLLQLGFSYYLNKDRIPEGWAHLPEIKGDEADISKFNLPKRYAVLTCAATVKVRELPAKTVNAVAKHCLSLGITPVFLGKRELLGTYKAQTSDEIDFSLGMDLREKTSLREAACILANAEFVSGLDNGLLHLASCSKVPVIFAFTTVDPMHRIVPREGITIPIVPDSSLKCRFCQSNMRVLLKHDYRHCLYKDNICCDLMTEGPFIKAIDYLMEKK